MMKWKRCLLLGGGDGPLGGRHSHGDHGAVVEVQLALALGLPLPLDAAVVRPDAVNCKYVKTI